MIRITLLQRVRNKLRISKNNTLDISPSTKISGCKIVIKGQNNKIIIKENCKLRDTFLEIIGTNCTIFIDKNTTIGKNCYLSAKEKNISLTIGKNCSLSRNAKLMTSDGHPIYQKNKRSNPAKGIMIKDNVWLADNVTILKNVTIEHDSVVGINSTVVKNISAHTIAVGNPAKIVKQGITWEE